MIKTTKRGGAGRGQGRNSLSGKAAGESPILRVRLPADLHQRAETVAGTAGLPLAEWVRKIIAQECEQAARHAPRRIITPS